MVENGARVLHIYGQSAEPELIESDEAVLIQLLMKETLYHSNKRGPSIASVERVLFYHQMGFFKG